MPNVRLTAISPGECGGDALRHVNDWCAKHDQAPTLHEDWHAMLDAPLDAVVICGPYEKHAEMATEFIRHGIHVLPEKPAALEMGDLNQLRDACRRHPDVHMACMTFLRYSPGFYTAHRLIAEGAIGDVRVLNARKSSPVPGRPDDPRDRATYGSTLLWVGSHAIDWILWYANSKVIDVQAFHTSSHNAGFGDFERSAVCNLAFENDAMASVSIDVFRPDAAPSHGDDWVRVVGTEGVMEIGNHSLSIIDRHGPREVPVSVDRQPFQDFIDHIAGRTRALIDAQSSLDVTEACIRARESADANRSRRGSLK